MIYLIGQLSAWLLLTAAFAALAGWAFAAERAAPVENARRRERENLVRDILKFAGGEDEPSTVEAERETDAMRRQLDLRDGRIAELERALESARAKADDAAEESEQLRAGIAEMEEEAMDTPVLAVAAEPVEAKDDDSALQAWRLRYFEQRVRYLESQARAQAGGVTGVGAPEPEAEPDAQPPALEWRVREAEARAAYLANELRSGAVAPVARAEEPPFAASADVDALLRWRMLYLERRLAHLQTQAAAAPALAPPVAGPDPDRWMWRARYLEARVRHLEQRAAPAQIAVEQVEEEAGPPAPSVAARKPPVLSAARDGAPDDLTLIEGVSALQQTTLNGVGVFHFDQIAAWTPENVAWVDQYFRLRGRIAEEEWVEQAADLARDGPAAARRAAEEV